MDNNPLKMPPIREVEELPEVAILNEVIFNKKDKTFYLGVDDNKKGVKKHGSHMESPSIRK